MSGAIRRATDGNRVEIILFAVERIGAAIEAIAGKIDPSAAVEIGFAMGEILDGMIWDLHSRGLCERCPTSATPCAEGGAEEDGDG